MNPLKIGWIDYSSDHRDKVMAVLHALSSEGAVDELGIGQVRDRFSDILFPGTSTIQTRAKYFFIIPYLLMEIEKESFDSPNKLINKLWDAELDLIDILLKGDRNGVIGASARKKLKRKPSEIYWSGLRTFGFLKSNLTLKSYTKAVYSQKAKQKSSLDFGSETESNINDIDGDNASTFWRCLSPEDNWKDNLKIELTREEASFLNDKIITADKSKDSLFAYLLEEGPNFLDKLVSLNSIESDSLPTNIKYDFIKAQNFNKFILGATIKYNCILSNGENEDANKLWFEWLESDFVKNHFISFDHKEILDSLYIKNIRLRQFLSNWQKIALSGNNEEINSLIIKREIELKGKDRAKLNNTKMFSFEQGDWIGSKGLEYRFNDAKIIMNDIFAGLEDK